MKRLLALAMLLLPLGAKADDPVYNNGDTFTAETVEGVTMTFRVTDAENKVCSLAGSCIDKATTGMITIPESAQGYSVQSIGVQAFIYCTGITEISVPGSVKTIETGAFSGCSGLATVSLEEGVETLDYQCFRDCESLTAITLPNSLKNLNEGVFLGCTKLATVSFGNSLQSIGRHAFSRCSSLTSVVIPDNVITMGDAVFYHCTGLTSVTLPANLTSIEASMFCGCSSLVSVNIPAGVTTIGDAAFLNCNSLASVIFPNGLTSIGKNAFMECLGLTSISLPSSLTTVGENAFQSCENIKSAIISKNMASIPNGLFDCCVGLTSVTIPKGVTTIGDRAFAVTSLSSIRLPNTLTALGVSALNCPNLTTVTIPASVTSIGDKCFDICRALKSVVVQWTTPINITSDVFLSDVYTGTLMVPYGTREAYAAAEGWKEFQNIKEMPGVGNRDLTGQPYRYWFDRNEANMQTGTLESNSLVVDLPTEGLSDWYHILHLQTQDDAGNWSAVVSRSFAVVPVSTAGNRDLTGQPYRYWFDRDEDNMQTGTLESNNLIVDLPTDGLSDWYHILHIQTQDDAGNWSAVVSRSFAVVPVSTAGNRDLTGQTYRYWFDRDEDNMQTGTLTGNNLVVDIPTDGLADWYHVLHLQTQDDAGNWSAVISRPFAVVPVGTAGSRDLTGQPYQYWYDENFDAAVEGTMAGNVLQLDAVVEGLADGVHVFHLRTRDDKGNWSAIISRKFSVGGNFGDILPWGTEEAWTAKYQFQSLEDYQEPANDASGHTWTELDYDDSAWETLTGPMSDSAPADGYNYRWDGDQNCFNLRRRFTLDEVSVGRYQLLMHHDDGVRVWLNGQQVVDDESWGRDYTYEIPMSAFVVGENILAIYVEEQSGNQLLDYCLTCTPVSAFDLWINSSGSGTVSLLDSDVREQTVILQAKPKTDVVINIQPDDGYMLSRLLVGNEDVTNKVVDGIYTIHEIVENVTISAYFLRAETIQASILQWGNYETWTMKSLSFPDEDVELETPPLDKKGQEWTALSYDDSEWETITGPMGNRDNPYLDVHFVVNWRESYYLRRIFHIENLPKGKFYFEAYVDEGFEVFINGVKIAAVGSFAWVTQEIPENVLVEGDNILAICYNPHGWTDGLDYAIYYKPFLPITLLATGRGSLSIDNVTAHDSSESTEVVKGESATITITPDPGYAIGQLQVNGEEIEISADSPSYTLTNISTETTVEVLFVLAASTKRGDMNLDGTIDLVDLVSIVDYIIGLALEDFDTEIADVNKDGEVNAADLVTLISLMMGEGTEIAPARLPSLQTEAADVLIGYVTADGRLCFDLQAETAYTACQLTLSLPAGADIKDVRLAAERSGGHVVTMGRREDGRVVVLVYSTANRPFLSQNGLFLEGVAQMANNGGIDVEDILFVTPKGTVRHFDSFSIDLAAGVASVKQEQHSDAPTYDLAGRRVGQTQNLGKGLYIQKGRTKLKN